MKTRLAPLALLLLAACATPQDGDVVIPNNILLPGSLYVGDAALCDSKNTNLVRYIDRKGLDICTGTEWRHVRVEGDSATEATGTPVPPPAEQPVKDKAKAKKAPAKTAPKAEPKT